MKQQVCQAIWNAGNFLDHGALLSVFGDAVDPVLNKLESDGLILFENDTGHYICCWDAITDSPEVT